MVVKFTILVPYFQPWIINIKRHLLILLILLKYIRLEIYFNRGQKVALKQSSNKSSSLLLQKRSTLMSLINVGLRLFFLRKNSRHYAVIPGPSFIHLKKKSLKIWVKIEKSGNFSTISLLNFY